MPSPSPEPFPAGSVLFVYPWCLDHIGHGNIQRVLAMAGYLARSGVTVDLVYQGNPHVPSREHEFTGFRRVLRVPAWTSSEDPRFVRECSTFFGGVESPPPNLVPGGALTMLTRGLLDAMDYTAVIGTYAWTAPMLEPLIRRAVRIVDLQDIMHLHGARSLEATGTTSNFSMEAETEAFLWRKWDVLLAITAEEARTIEPTLRPSQLLLTVPHAVRIVTLDHGGDPDRVLYMGSDNSSNQQAVVWLLREVWPQVLTARPGARLRVAGLICKALAATPLADTPGLELAGFVEDPERELADALVVVAPYLYGSGLKIKVVETAGAGRALVTTSGGIEGTGLRHDEHVLVADAPDAFARAIVTLLDNPEQRQRLTAAARTHVAQAFSEDACYGSLLALLQTRTETPLTPGVIPPSVQDRLREAVESVHGDVVIWGNGSHTRALMEMLTAMGTTVLGILDKDAPGGTSSPEGVPVMRPGAYVPGQDDLVVLSSQTFESEIWEQASELRDRGTHVLALYRRQLITDVLKQRLRSWDRERSQRPWPVRPVTGSTRLVIVEPGAGRGRGHFYRFARSIAVEAPAIGVEVLMAGARVPTLEGLDSEDRDMIVPAFEFAHWDAVAELDDDPWRGLTRFSNLLAGELERLHRLLSLRSHDVVLFLMANLVDVLAAGTWLARQPRAEAPRIRLLFHFLPSQEAHWFRVTEPALGYAYELALALLRERCGNGLRLYAQSDALADDLVDALRWPVRPIGFPVPRRLLGASRPEVARPARILYAGEARTDKGFGLLPGITDALAAERDAGAIVIVCQSMPNEFADEPVRAAIRTLKACPGVELIERFLPSGEYDDLIAGCDLILLPYEADQYRSRLSAVFVDATCAGVPVVVPAGTWMAHQLDEHCGAGTVFSELSSESIAAVVRQLLPRLAELKRAAHAVAARAAEPHDPRAVLRALMDPD